MITAKVFGEAIVATTILIIIGCLMAALLIFTIETWGMVGGMIALGVICLVIVFGIMIFEQKRNSHA